MMQKVAGAIAVPSNCQAAGDRRGAYARLLATSFALGIPTPSNGVAQRSNPGPLPREQRTRKTGLITICLAAESDPGCVKTPKGRSRRGIVFYRRRGFRVVLQPLAREEGHFMRLLHVCVSSETPPRTSATFGR